MATPVFDGANEIRDQESAEVWQDWPIPAKPTLYDGRTGDPFDRPVTVGYMYMLETQPPG